MSEFKPFLEKVASGHTLSTEEAGEAFGLIMSGAVPQVQIAGFLVALRSRGETVEEITGAARAMRAKMRRVRAPEGTIDIVGTGGDAKGTHNVSTCAAFVTAGAGVPVAKHGNRSVSSKSGAADVLEHLGLGLTAAPGTAEESLRQAGIAFLFAPAHHEAMRHVVPTRKALGIRTIFNLLGPLCNPAEVKRLLLGVFSRGWVVPMAETLLNLGAERAWVVHGADGLDELSTTGPSYVVEIANGRIREFELEPEDAGLQRSRLDDLIGGTPSDNASAIRGVLSGAPGPFRDIVLLNTAAALVIAGAAADLKTGAELAAAAIDTGKAAAALEKLIEITNTPAHA